jgi:hypothetical protein
LKIFKIILKIIGFAIAAIFAFIVTCIIAIEISLGGDALQEQPLGEYPSADGKHICSVHVSDGGATTPWTVVAEVSGTWIIGKRTVYVVDHINQAKVIWIDDRTVWINGVSLDIYRDKYVSNVDSLNGT